MIKIITPAPGVLLEFSLTPYRGEETSRLYAAQRVKPMDENERESFRKEIFMLRRYLEILTTQVEDRDREIARLNKRMADLSAPSRGPDKAPS